MRVSELERGMLIRPKTGFKFRVYKGYAVDTGDVYTQLECHKRKSPHQDVGTAPVVYIGKAPKADREHTYEARRSVFVTTVGQQMKVAPEAWRNMEAIPNAN